MSTTARIYDQGYQRYDGERRGVAHAVRSTAVLTFRYIVGMRRRTRSKVLPWGILALSYLPALGFVAVVAFLPPDVVDFAGEVLPGPEEYLGGTILLVYLATAIAGPAALCPDRRSGSLALYLASPLSRDTYLLGKGLAVTGFIFLATGVPPAIYVLGTVLAGAGPSGPWNVAVSVVQVVVAGAVAALLYGGLSAAVASLTDRQGAASAFTVLYVAVSAAVVGAVTGLLDLPQAVGLLDVSQAAVAAVFRVYGEDGGSNVPAPLVMAAAAGWIVALWSFARWRYRHLEVTR